MSTPLHTTKAIILRAVKYGETSLIVSAYTELLGLQSYIVQGVRVSSKKGSGKANYFQPGSVLELVVYHHELKNLQRIKEFRWSYLYTSVFSDVVKNCVLLYMVELLQKCIKQPEGNADLFSFAEEALIQLDTADEITTAGFPIYFSLQLAHFFGFQINHEQQNTVLDLQEGSFVNHYPQHVYYADGKIAELLFELLKVMQPSGLAEVPMNHLQRRAVLEALETYYALHLSEFGKMKTLPVLQEVLS
ncbi:MAG: DNA repair protein RecO [Chitinophagaceae bacterium]|nr:DNA repair protein RecO [Chitinophagaceae bacterium]